jgi:hypothetical protein
VAAWHCKRARCHRERHVLGLRAVDRIAETPAAERLPQCSQDQGFGFWQPNMGGWTIPNSSFVSIGTEWWAFVGRRVKENLHLWQELAGAKTPQSIWAAYSDFWQRAVEDYWNEYATFAKFSGTSLENLMSELHAREEPSLHARAA